MAFTLSEALDAALGDVKMSHEHAMLIDQAVAKVSDAKKQMSEAQKELDQAITNTYAQLATAIRKIQPSLVISLRPDGCVVGYRTKCIICKVDPVHSGLWDFSSSDMGVLFSRRYGKFQIDNPIENLARLLAEFFSNQYRSLMGSHDD